MNNIRTVSDTKKAFYNSHTRPINSIYNRVVEELLVEMHLISVNADYSYNPFYALGIVTAFDRFMEGYSPEQDKISIFNALIQAQEEDSDKYRADAKGLEDLASQMSGQDMISWICLSADRDDAQHLQDNLRAISDGYKFKYNRLFAIGLFTLLEIADTELVKEQPQRTEAIKKISQALNLPEEKLLKDIEMYRSNLERIIQARNAMEDSLMAARKKRDKRRSLEEGNIPTSPSNTSKNSN
ncbi:MULTISPECIES: photosystem II biogenesis protein Psp29 [Okeania]|uniref:Protein Thf1 n=1 Tax=Okeania hirsuta TaxID=1458930 RepID=A0A3N6NX53_9CYAN|nr:MULTISPECIES: photosystem II biogenesis protein Psp29 [Okeania]NES78144.1 photosystem II biogenesis protein Psp29 [Okeania sp. SIO1H4]NET21816.1 photosystem II biogenesis protein Psp29 [Okeania sp. SIO1H5]NET78970.1 photosystem II biogenesis protein Psp29 [Okeania sp. SIO1F9]NET95210.1 photosystem II biogenesis protein Psp29 [Okeania sp. SIO1H2]RQH16976.1 photosystem II biogenesis protein Psp29 [Okeania hirsuta]